MLKCTIPKSGPITVLPQVDVSKVKSVPPKYLNGRVHENGYFDPSEGLPHLDPRIENMKLPVSFRKPLQISGSKAPTDVPASNVLHSPLY